MVVLNDEKCVKAVSELVSALSALAMPPQPLNNGEMFLADNDHWAQHSCEHINKAIAILAEID